MQKIYYGRAVYNNKEINAVLKVLKNESLTLIDGKYVPSGLLNAEAFIGGDKVHQQISAASIYAKYFRDNLMGQYAQIFPKYYFEKNKGYPTQMHKEAIIEFGLSKIHRKSFKMK